MQTKQSSKAGERTQLTSGEYIAQNKSVNIYRPDTHPINRMIRIYCTMMGAAWKLQIRGPLGIGCNGTRDGKSSIIANVDLSLPEMIALRDALDEFILEVAE